MSEKWKFSRHARVRMAEMALDRREVLTALVRPEVVFDAFHREHPQGRRFACRGRITVVFEPVGKHIITVMWRQAFSRSAGPLAIVGT